MNENDVVVDKTYKSFPIKKENRIGCKQQTNGNLSGVFYNVAETKTTTATLFNVVAYVTLIIHQLI